MPYLLKLADEGVHRALGADPGFMKGLNVAAGKLTYEPVARDQGLEYTPAAGRARGGAHRVAAMVAQGASSPARATSSAAARGPS